MNERMNEWMNVLLYFSPAEIAVLPPPSWIALADALLPVAVAVATRTTARRAGRGRRRRRWRGGQRGPRRRRRARRGAAAVGAAGRGRVLERIGERRRGIRFHRGFEDLAGWGFSSAALAGLEEEDEDEDEDEDEEGGWRLPAVLEHQQHRRCLFQVLFFFSRSQLWGPKSCCKEAKMEGRPNNFSTFFNPSFLFFSFSFLFFFFSSCWHGHRQEPPSLGLGKFTSLKLN